jgi:hypothetical protein
VPWLRLGAVRSLESPLGCGTETMFREFQSVLTSGGPGTIVVPLTHHRRRGFS